MSFLTVLVGLSLLRSQIHISPPGLTTRTISKRDDKVNYPLKDADLKSIYQLGFSNLSHFSRLFEKHIGMKPKKYSAHIKL